MSTDFPSMPCSSLSSPIGDSVNSATKSVRTFPLMEVEGHKFDIESSQDRFSFCNLPCVVSPLKQLLKGKLGEDHNGVSLEVIRELPCSVHHHQNSFLQ